MIACIARERSDLVGNPDRCYVRGNNHREDDLVTYNRDDGRFACPGCGEKSFPDEVGVVTCDECGAHTETLEPLGLRQILPNFWTRLRGSAAPAIPPKEGSDA